MATPHKIVTLKAIAKRTTRCPGSLPAEERIICAIALNGFSRGKGSTAGVDVFSTESGSDISQKID